MDIEITINGRKLKTKTGLTILEAASQAGIKIPNMCYLKRLRPIGSCRICSVEVKGIEHPVPSCVAKVKDGYEIHTDTKKVWNIRKEALSHLLLDHPLDCPVCDKSGDCLLQDLSFEFGMTKQKNKKLYPDRTKIFNSEHIEYMATRCVLCSRCIRVCSDMYGNPFYEIKGTGYESYIGLRRDDKTQCGGTPTGSSFREVKNESDILKCYYCGNCIEVCPVGALISKQSKFKARYWGELPFSSVCDKCSAACRIEYYRYPKEESLVRTASLFGGYLCKFGFFYEAIGKNNEYYISSPFIKNESVLMESTLENAIGELGSRIKNISEKGEMKYTAVLVSPSISTQEGFVIANFVKDVLKPGYFDIAEPEFYRENLNGFKKAFENEGTFNIKSVQNSDIILYLGAIEDEIPYVSYNIMRGHREYGAKLLLINIKNENNRLLTRFEDIAYARRDIDINSVHEFLQNLHSGILDYVPEKSGDIIKSIAESDSIAIMLGGYLMSGINMKEDFAVLKKISEFLRGKKKNVEIYPLIKPFNYRGLESAGISSPGLYGFHSIISGLNAGEIKNLIYFGDFSNDNAAKEIVKHADSVEFLAVLSSKTSVLSNMANVVIPLADFLEKRDSFYENFEGKTISLNNEFKLGQYRNSILPVLIEISAKLGYSFNYMNNETSGFTDSLKTKDIIAYNRVKARSNFYYNDKTKIFY